MKNLKETERTDREKYLYHNTELLLKRYRDVVWSVEASLEQAKLGFESEMECKLEEFLELSYIAGFDLSNTDIEEHMRTLERNRKMLSYIDSAAKLLRKKQPDGETLYLIIFYTYLSEKKFESTDEILTKIIEHKIYLTEKRVYYLLIFILMTSGLFAVATQIAGFPPASTAKGIKLAVREDKGFMDFVNTYFIMPFVKVLAPFIHIAPFKEKRMALRLARAEIKFTPKEYLARSVLMSASTGAVAFLLLTFTMSNLSFLGIVIGIVVFFHFNGEVNDKLKEKDKLIEAELPKFIRAIVQGLKTEKDIIKLLETYQTISGKTYLLPYP